MMKNIHSVILDKDKCRGCTNCIAHCPTEAIRVRKGKAWDFTVALPAPTLYGQFKDRFSIDMILTALKQIGFDDVFEVASAKRLKAKPENFPLISSSCPAVVRLIQIRFPGLIDQIVRIEEITETLPGLDCCSCGAPTCRALAEDIVRGTAEKNDCIFILRDEMITLTKHLAELGSWMPPLLSEEQKKK